MKIIILFLHLQKLASMKDGAACYPAPRYVFLNIKERDRF